MKGWPSRRWRRCRATSARTSATSSWRPSTTLTKTDPVIARIKVVDPMHIASRIRNLLTLTISTLLTGNCRGGTSGTFLRCVKIVIMDIVAQEKHILTRVLGTCCSCSSSSVFFSIAVLCWTWFAHSLYGAFVWISRHLSNFYCILCRCWIISTFGCSQWFDHKKKRIKTSSSCVLENLQKWPQYPTSSKQGEYLWLISSK